MDQLKEFFETVGTHPGVWAFLLGLGLFYGILKPFEKLDSIVSKDLRETIALWLLDVERSDQIRNWPETFAAIFDRVFGEKHVTWRCFFRSVIASFVGLAVMSVVVFVVNPEQFFRTLAEDSTAVAVVLVAGGILNLFPDYFSLLETRLVLGRMQRADRGGLVGWIVVDSALTTALSGVGWLALALYVEDDPLTFWVQTYWVSFFPLQLRLADPSGIFLWTTYFTSLWLWLYVLSGLLVRALGSVGRGALFVRDHLNVEEKPLSAIGFVAGGLIACVWWGIGLKSWLF